MTRPTLDPFTQAYCEAALWTSDPRPGQGEYQADLNVIPDDLLAEAVEDCRQFQISSAADLQAAYALWETPDRAGMDFWLTRNGHGAGFWDRGLGELGERLTQAAKTWGTVDEFSLLFDQGEEEE